MSSFNCFQDTVVVWCSNILIKHTRLMEIFEELAYLAAGIRSTKNRKNINFANFSSGLYPPIYPNIDDPTGDPSSQLLYPR